MSLIDRCPSAMHRAALRLVGAALGGPVTQGLLEDLAQVDPVALAGLLNVQHAHTVVAAVQGRDPRLDAALPEDLWLYLAEMRAANRDRMALGVQDLGRIGALLGGAGISAVVLKGGAEMLDPLVNPAAIRFVSDLDILVPYDRAREAQALLSGQSPDAVAFPDRIDAAVLHHLDPLHPEGHEFPIELHFHVGQSLVRRVLDAPGVLDRATPSAVAGIALPSMRDRFLHHVLHYAKEHHADHGLYLRGLVDHHAFRQALTAQDRAAAETSLRAAGLGHHLQILDALTDMVLGQDPGAMSPATSRWLRRCLQGFGSPARRRLSASLTLLYRVPWRFVTSRYYRRRYLGILRDPAVLKGELGLQRDRFGKLR
ncbi:nucleotidyltransferase family protein [Tropicibacter oceani]|uniref:Nucleotidyltransferase family protein n=1 Tax=Tropicibacter oceani TaxID=3058420 RepID=A0ABY8QH61_9RHOB|nr:nucleotidyltransferase family protein [Tropicibacter oceani]WGW03306.1 nucleotidyltransferase family protein [Tropicibacter oceani]